jgi:hypothetical protein
MSVCPKVFVAQKKILFLSSPKLEKCKFIDVNNHFQSVGDAKWSALTDPNHR